MSGLSVQCIRTHFCDSIINMNCVLNYTKYGLTVFKPKRTQIPTSWRVRKDVETGGKGGGGGATSRFYMNPTPIIRDVV